MTPRCPACGCERLFGPATIIGPDGEEYLYYDCQRCHSLVTDTTKSVVTCTEASTVAHK